MVLMIVPRLASYTLWMGALNSITDFFILSIIIKNLNCFLRDGDKYESNQLIIFSAIFGISENKLPALYCSFLEMVSNKVFVLSSKTIN